VNTAIKVFLSALFGLVAGGIVVIVLAVCAVGIALLLDIHVTVVWQSFVHLEKVPFENWIVFGVWEMCWAWVCVFESFRREQPK